MTLLEKLHEQMKTAMREKNQARLSVLRMLINEIKNENKVQGKQRSQEEVCLAYHKKLTKSVEQFPNEHRQKILDEIKITEEFLPKMMSTGEIKEFIKNNVKPEDINMKTVMPMLKGKADGETVKNIVMNWNKQITTDQAQ